MNRLEIWQVLIVFLTLGSITRAGVISIEEENDFFAYRHKDQFYTQGLLLSYKGDERISTNGIRNWSIYGFRNQFYTPKNISIPTPQPDDRPWAGMTAVSKTDWEVTSKNSTMTEYLVGVVGAWSLSEQIQTTVHKWIDSETPMGWSNQIPNEIVVNVTRRWFYPRAFYGSRNSWCADATEIYGGSLGNAFVNAEVAALFRAGYRVPSEYKTEIITPTLTRHNRFSFYGTVEVEGRAVFQNIMLGGSLFTDGPQQELKSFVSDIKYGLCAGIEQPLGLPADLSFSWVLVHRSFEFIGQDEPADFGCLTLSLSGGF